MNAARELLDDLALIGATVEPAGDRLILRAGPMAIPARLVNRVREAKAELIATLARPEASEQDPSDESQRQFKCRTMEAYAVEWLNQHPAPSQSGRCAWCGRAESPDALVVPFGTEPGTHAWLHAECWTAWYQQRREEAVLAMGITRPDTTMIDGVSPVSSAAERMRPYRERRTRGLPCITVEPPAEAPQPQPSASNGIPEDRRGFVGYVDGRFVHFCPECGEWGAHGIGVFLRRGQLGVWYCAEHKPKR
jgi:hypothetical protein